METNAWDVIVVGAGAAGLMAATQLGKRGLRSLIVEKNRKPGVKILMSGGTRCNLTQDTDRQGIIRAFGRNGKFLHSALAEFSPQDTVRFFESEGVATKVESTGKVFPVSDRALDVQQLFVRLVREAGVEMRTASPVSDIRPHSSGGFEVCLERETLLTRRVLLTVGGQSYPGCGTTGDGYRWLARLGHQIVTPSPALTPLRSSESWVKELAGVTIPSVSAGVLESAKRNDCIQLSKTKLQRKFLAESTTSFLFTHKGLSGPAPMNVSAALTNGKTTGPYLLIADFLPDGSAEQTKQWLEREAKSAGKRQVESVLGQTLPKRLAQAILTNTSVASDRPMAELSKRQLDSIVMGIHRTEIRLDGTLGFAKAEVTAGGISLGEVNSSTMESKLITGLYFAGELLDLDGPIGGFNFQAAFSTGWLAAHRIEA